MFEVEILHSFMDPTWLSTKQFGFKVGEKYIPNGPIYNECTVGVMTTPKETHEALGVQAISGIQEMAPEHDDPLTSLESGCFSRRHNSLNHRIWLTFRRISLEMHYTHPGRVA